MERLMRAGPASTEATFEPDRLQAWATIAPGTAAMSVVGMQSLSLGNLVEAGHFSSRDSLTALLCELFCMGVAVAVAGTFLNARRLRLVYITAALGASVLNLAVAVVHGAGIVAVMAVEGAMSGLLIWITLGMLARRRHPEGWAAGFFMTQSAGQLVLGAMEVALFMPVFGPTGPAFAAALVLAASTLAAFALPNAYPAPPTPGLPTAQGGLGLLALFLYVCGSAGAWFQMRGLLGAYQLPQDLGGVIVIANLAGQAAGSAAGVLSVHRLSDAKVFVLSCLLAAAAWICLLMHPPMSVFVAAYALTGFAGILMGTRLFSFLTRLDPTRRAAQISALAQLTGAAAGPALGAGLGGSIGLAIGSLALVLLLQAAQRPVSPTRQSAGQGPR
jgi:hypothetical protein